MSKKTNRKFQTSQSRTSLLPQAVAPSRLARFKPSRAQLVSSALIFSAAALVFAAHPNNFTPGTTISATAMNDNFSALDARIAAIETKLASVSNVTVNGQPTVRFTGVNVQVVNGMDATATANGTGNLIVGYDEADISGRFRCTIGTNPVTSALVIDQATCTAAGGSWGNTGFKTGSHYVVTGTEHNYSRFGGLLAGFRNTSNNDYASVSGGQGSSASGRYASVSGGVNNTASGNNASVSGGANSLASGGSASVSGGAANTASGDFAASVSGGHLNVASGHVASVSGGEGCNTGNVSQKWTVGQSAIAGCSATLGN